MIIELQAKTNVAIQDLGVILNTGDVINLLENFETDQLIDSIDLKTEIQNSNVETTIDSDIVNYNEFIRRISNLTKHEHYNLNQLQHNLYDDNYFKVTKQSGKSKFITYYKDSSMVDKIQEDEIVRDASGKVSEIITRKFNTDGTVYQKLTQILNRNTEGKVESISTNTI